MHSEDRLNMQSQCLDTGEEFAFDTSYDQAQVVNSVGDALMQFLDSLPTSIVPSSLHERCELAADQAEAFEVCLRSKPRVVR